MKKIRNGNTLFHIILLHRRAKVFSKIPPVQTNAKNTRTVSQHSNAETNNENSSVAATWAHCICSAVTLCLPLFSQQNVISLTHSVNYISLKIGEMYGGCGLVQIFTGVLTKQLKNDCHSSAWISLNPHSRPPSAYRLPHYETSSVSNGHDVFRLKSATSKLYMQWQLPFFCSLGCLQGGTWSEFTRSKNNRAVRSVGMEF